jgi:hypothetical protein
MEEDTRTPGHPQDDEAPLTQAAHQTADESDRARRRRIEEGAERWMRREILSRRSARRAASPAHRTRTGVPARSPSSRGHIPRRNSAAL